MIPFDKLIVMPIHTHMRIMYILYLIITTVHVICLLADTVRGVRYLKSWPNTTIQFLLAENALKQRNATFYHALLQSANAFGFNVSLLLHINPIYSILISAKIVEQKKKKKNEMKLQ